MIAPIQVRDDVAMVARFHLNAVIEFTEMSPWLSKSRLYRLQNVIVVNAKLSLYYHSCTVVFQDCQRLPRWTKKSPISTDI